MTYAKAEARTKAKTTKKMATHFHEHFRFVSFSKAELEDFW